MRSIGGPRFHLTFPPSVKTASASENKLRCSEEILAKKCQCNLCRKARSKLALSQRIPFFLPSLPLTRVTCRKKTGRKELIFIFSSAYDHKGRKRKTPFSRPRPNARQCQQDFCKTERGSGAILVMQAGFRRSGSDFPSRERVTTTGPYKTGVKKEVVGLDNFV